MKTRLSTFALLLGTVALGACRDQSPTALPPVEHLSLITSTSAINPYVAFLAPVEKGATVAGTFNPDLALVIEICRLDESALPPACVGGSVASFSTADGSVTVSEADGYYKASWNTDAVPAGESYRIKLFVSGVELSRHADLRIAADRSGAKNKKDGEAVAYNSGRTIPIKVHIGTLALAWERGQDPQAPANTIDCSNNECIEVVETNVQPTNPDGTGDPQVVKLPSELGAVVIPDGWIDPALFPEGVTLTLIQVDPDNIPGGEECLGGGFALEAEGTCLFATTSPDVGTFLVPLDVFICRTAAMAEGDYDLYRFDETNETTTLLDETTTASPIPCESEPVIVAASPPAGAGPISRLAWNGWNRIARPAARLLAPKALYAGDRNTLLGGQAPSFSRFRGAVTLYIDNTTGGAQSAATGTELPQPLTVFVTKNHIDNGIHVDGQGFQPAPGATVTFVITADPSQGGASLAAVSGATAGSASVTATTGANGAASAYLLLGGATGSYQVTATVPGDPALAFTTTTFTATATVTVPPQTGGLVSFWSMENVANSLVPDNSGPNTGTLSGGVGPTTAGVSGSALAFDNLNGPGYMTAAGTGIDTAQAVTLSAWVNLDSSGAANGIQRFVTLLNEKAVIRMDGTFGPANSLHFYVISTSGGEGIYASGALAQRGCYHHVAGSYDDSTKQLNVYLNGANVASSVAASTFTIATGSGVRLSSNSSEPLRGSMDEVKVFSRAVTAAEVQALFDEHKNNGATCWSQNIIQ